MSEATERRETPATDRVEVGQVWRYNGHAYEVAKRLQAYCYGHLWAVTSTDGGTERQLALDAPCFASHFAFVGYTPGHEPATPVPMMGETRDGCTNPVGCLACGQPWDVDGWAWIWCKACDGRLDAATLMSLAKDWRDGARDFPPRLPTAVPVSEPAKPTAEEIGRILGPAVVPQTAREILAERAAKREAKRLENQQAVCAFVNDFDLLRDA